jgi:hypothetical protein
VTVELDTQDVEVLVDVVEGCVVDWVVLVELVVTGVEVELVVTGVELELDVEVELELVGV